MTIFKIAALALLCGGAAQAQTMTYECQIDGTRDRDWIQSLIFIGHNTATGDVRVSDVVTLAFNDRQPVKGRVKVDNSARITFVWDVETVAADNKKTTMSYRATYVKGTGQVNVFAQPRGFHNNFNRGGRCTVNKLKG